MGVNGCEFGELASVLMGVNGFTEVMELVFSSWQDIALTENHIRQLHRDLLTHSDKDAWHRGNYKTTSNNVVAFDELGNPLGVVFETAAPFDTPRLLSELVTWFNEQRSVGRLHPLLLIALQIVDFTRDHGRITMAEAIRLTGSNRNTLKQHFRTLVEQGHLILHGSGRGTWYELR